MAANGAMLRLARQRLGFTPEPVAAARLGVVQPVLARMENARQMIAGQRRADAARRWLMRCRSRFFFDSREPGLRARR